MKITKKEFFSQHDLANPCLHQYLRKIDADLAEKVRLGGCLYCLLGVLPAHHGITPERMAALRRALGIDRRTLERWRQWWLESFVQEPYWKLARAAFMPPLCQETLPLSLARAFAVGWPGQLIALLKFLSPITTGSIPLERCCLGSFFFRRGCRVPQPGIGRR